MQESESSQPNIEEDYANWKTNVPFLYDIAITNKLVWPSLTVQWFPEIKFDQNDNELYRLLIGTNTSGEEQNYLKIVEVCLPSTFDNSMDPTLVNNIRKLQKVGGVTEIMSIPHKGEVNRARYMTQNTNIIASWTPMGEIHVFDITQTENQLILQLQLHDKEGYGLSWSPLEKGQLLTAGYDNQIGLWDIESGSTAPKQVFRHHQKQVEDVSWNQKNESVFVSCSDDCTVAIVDVRTSGQVTQFKAHDQDVNCVHYNPMIEYLLLTGSADTSIKLFDMRQTQKELHTFEHHDEPIYGLQWSPHDSRYFASGSQDRKVILWDMGKIGAEIKAEDERDGPAEMLFVHSGHQSKVNDISWNPHLPFLMASVEENTNVLQMWKMQRTVLDEENEDDQMMLEELTQNK